MGAKVKVKVRATPAVLGDTAVVADFGGRLAALRPTDGGKAWTLELGHPVYSSACLRGDLRVLGCNEGHLHGVDVRSGAARREIAKGGIQSSPALDGDRAFVGSARGVHALRLVP